MAIRGIEWSLDDLKGYRLLNAGRLYLRDLIFGGTYILRKFRPTRGPILLCNSYMKSGTHLLHQILCAIPGFHKWWRLEGAGGVTMQSNSGVMNTLSHIRWKLGSIPSHRVVTAHLPYCDEILEILNSKPCKRFFIYRDLRDNAVSLAKWAFEERRFYLHPIYRYHLKDEPNRLMAAIVGTPLGSPFGSNVSRPPIGLDFQQWEGWLDDPETLSVRFEDLVGTRGGGSDAVRYATVKRILEHVETFLPDGDIEARFSTENLNPNQSATFNTGMIGGWKKAFNQEHKDVFKALNGDLLIKLGYEKDQNW